MGPHGQNLAQRMTWQEKRSEERAAGCERLVWVNSVLFYVREDLTLGTR